MPSVLQVLNAAIARRSWSYYQRITFDGEARIGGSRFDVPVGQRRGLSLLEFSEEEEKFVGLLRSILSGRSGSVLDVGANIGRFLLYVASIDREIRYFGFDVQPACIAYVKTLIFRNELRYSQAIAVGLSDQTGMLTLRTGGDDDVNASTIPEFYDAGKFSQEYMVPVLHGDSLAEPLKFGDVSLIKVDVEGGELEVLRGLERTIVINQPNIVIEVAPYVHAKDRRVRTFRRDRIIELNAYLTSLDYSFWKIEGGDRVRRVRSLDPGSSENIQEMDYLCKPKV